MIIGLNSPDHRGGRGGEMVGRWSQSTQPELSQNERKAWGEKYED